MTHKEVVLHLIENNSIVIGDAFDYTDHDLEQIFELFFQFAQENLNLNDYSVSIDPARIYYRNIDTINARAGLSSGIYVVGINRGTIEKLYDFFISLDEVFDLDILAEYSAIDNLLSDSLVYLMYQLCTTFTYYHEKAHLLQKSAEIHSFEEEYKVNSANEIYSQLHHTLELDADLYAAFFCAMHILGYWDDLPEESKTEKSLLLLSSCAVASIFSYWLLLLGNNNEIYYKASDHPHPVIRITYLVTSIAETLKSNYDNYLNINVNEVVQKSIILSDAFFRIKGKNNVEEYMQMFIQESSNIKNYINELLEFANDQANLTMHFMNNNK